jgi:anti-sigma B factor antagonist
MTGNYSVRQVGQVTVLDLSGRISLQEEQVGCTGDDRALHEVVRDFVQKGNKKILLNLRHATYIDSSGLGELFFAMTTVLNQGGQLGVCNATGRIGDLMRMTHLDTLLHVEQEEATALQAFSARANTSAA